MASIIHPEARRLVQLAADAKIQPAERLALEAHLLECAKCSAYARELDALQGSLRRSMHRRWDPVETRVPLGKIQNHSRRKNMFNRFSLTAATLGVMALLVVAFAFMMNGQPRIQNTPVAAAPTASQTSPRAATPTSSIKPLVLSGDIKTIFIGEPSWSPDGKHIVFTSENTANASSMQIVNADGSGLRQLAESADTILNWSEDGSQVVFCLYSRVFEGAGVQLFSVSVDGSRLTEITNEKVRQNLKGVYGGCNFIVSPDRNSLAYSTNPFGGGLYVMDTNGENFHELVRPPAGVYDFVWSPDGKIIVFLGQDGFNNSFSSGLYEVRSDGGEIVTDWKVIPLFRDARSNATFSPDGGHIAYQTDSGLYTANIHGGDPLRLVEIASNGGRETTWSPDGTQIAFLAGVQVEELCAINTDGSNLRCYHNPGRVMAHPRWSPDGQQLAFVSIGDPIQEAQLLLINVRDLQPQP